MDTKVTKVSDGTYQAKYSPLNYETSNYLMTVLVEKEIVAKFSIKSKQGSSSLRFVYLADYDQCIIDGPGLEQLMVYVLGYDSKPCYGRCKVLIDGKKMETKDIGESRWLAKYPPLNSAPGEYIMDVIVDKTTIAKFRIKVVSKGSKFIVKTMANVKSCIMEAPTPTETKVTIYDFEGEHADADLTATIKGPTGDLHAHVESQGNGVYLIQYDRTDEVSGDYFFNILIDGVVFKNFKVQVVSKKKKIKSYGQPASVHHCFADEPHLDHMLVHLLGEDGNPGDGKPTVQIKSSKGMVKVTFKQVDGVYRFEYPILNNVSDTYTLQALVNGHIIAKFGLEVKVGSTDFHLWHMADPHHCEIKDVTEKSLTVICKAYDGHPVECEDVKCTVGIEGPKGSLDVQVESSSEAGVFHATYPNINDVPGSYKIHAEVDGQNIGKYNIQVKSQ